MLPVIYSTRYRDHRGEEKTTISNSGQELRMVLRGIEFFTTNFNWAPCTADPSQLLMFSFPDQQFLGDYLLEFDVPVSVASQNELLQAILRMQWVEEGNPSSPSFMVEVTASLFVMNQTFHSQKKQTDDFEEVLKSLHKELPQGMYIKICSFCAFSDYNPYAGGGGFCLDCLKKDKEGYLQIASKGPKEPGFNFKRAYNRLKIETTQVISWCPEFLRRSPDHFGI